MSLRLAAIAAFKSSSSPSSVLGCATGCGAVLAFGCERTLGGIMAGRLTSSNDIWSLYHHHLRFEHFWVAWIDYFVCELMEKQSMQ